MRQIRLNDKALGWAFYWQMGIPFMPPDTQNAAVYIDGELAGGVTFDHVTGTSCQMHALGRPGWLQRDILRTMFQLAFDYLQVTKIIAPVSSSMAFPGDQWQRAGYKLEARIEGAFPHGDMVIYTMTREQCRFLENGHG